MSDDRESLSRDELERVVTKRISDEELFWRDWQRYQGNLRWRAILDQADQDLHVSQKVLQDLILRWGVPTFAGAYVAGRWDGTINPPGKPANPPAPDPRFPEWANPIMKRKSMLVWWVHHWTRHYQRFVARQTPRPGNAERLRHDAACGGWTVRAPKREAQEAVARRFGVSRSTLKDWEHDCQVWRQRILAGEGVVHPITLPPAPPEADVTP